MNVIIFEDSKGELDDLKSNLESFFKNYQLDYSLIETTEPNIIYNNLDKADLIFLDIEVDQHNGIDVGLKIREINKDTVIILISNYSKYLIDGYKIKADRYFLKPLEKINFQIEMRNVISFYIKQNQSFFNPKVSNHKIYYKNIIYIEFINRKSYLHCLNNKCYESPYQLIYWKNKLAEQPFAQTHRAFIVNMSSISAYNTKEINMINQTNIPLSRVYRESFEKSYLKYVHSWI